MNLREEFKQLIQEQEYQKVYSYEERCEIFDKLQLSTSITYFNPVMALSTFLLEHGRVRGYDIVRHGMSHSGAVATAFNKLVKEDKSPYLTVVDKGKYDVVTIFNYKYNLENKFQMMLRFFVYDDYIQMKFYNMEFFADPNFCFYKTANNFLEAIGKPRFFIHKSQIKIDESKN